MIVAEHQLETLETREAPLWWHRQGLSYTASGYGRRIPTKHMVRLPGNPRWRRVYCCCWSNIGTCYVEAATRDPETGRRNWIVIW